MARISLDPPRALLYRVLERYSVRAYGDILEPGPAFAHNSRAIWALRTCAFSRSGASAALSRPRRILAAGSPTSSWPRASAVTSTR